MWGERRPFSRARAAGAGLVIVFMVFLGGLSSVRAFPGGHCFDSCGLPSLPPISAPVGPPISAPMLAPLIRPTVTTPPTDTAP